jgi:hypothetical protein
MTNSLLALLSDEFLALLEPLLDAVEDEGARRRLLAAVGADPALGGDDGMLSALQALADLRSQIDQVVTNQSESLAAIAALLKAADDLNAAARALGHSSGDAYAGLGVDLVFLLTGEYLRIRHPLVRAIGVLLTVIQLAGQRPPAPAVVDGTRVVRRPFWLDRIRFDRFGPLLHDPVGVLRTEYLAGNLATVADANATADQLFPRVGGVLTELGVQWAYGLLEDDRPLLGDAAALVDHALVIHVPSALIGDAVDAGIVLTLASADRGDLGLVVSPFGALHASQEVGAWKIELALTADVQAFAIGRHGPTLLMHGDSAEITGRLGASLIHQDNSPVFVFGAPTGTRLELGAAELSLELGLSTERTSIASSASLTRSALVIAAGDGDGFLKAVLPSDGLRATFDLGLAYATGKGLSLHGGAGLETTLPIAITLADVVTLEAIYLALAASEAGISFEVSAIASLDIGPLRSTWPFAR